MTESDVVDVLESILGSPSTSKLLMEYALIALMKLTSRYSTCVNRVKTILEKYKYSHDLELQVSEDNLSPQCLRQLQCIKIIGFGFPFVI